MATKLIRSTYRLLPETKRRLRARVVARRPLSENDIVNEILAKETANDPEPAKARR